MTASSDAPPATQSYKARVRLSAAATAPWEDVEAYDAEAAACIVVARSQSGSTHAAGRLPVEVTVRGSVVVERFDVEYQISHKATRTPESPQSTDAH